MEAAYRRYQLERQALGRGDRPVTLMDLATHRRQGAEGQGGCSNDLDESEEINACTVKLAVDKLDGSREQWLLLFKNETHNHPTEIEPFGGAATCIGGAIRGPPCPSRGLRVPEPCGSPVRRTPPARWRIPCPASCLQRQLVTLRRRRLQRLRQPDRPGHLLRG